LLVNYSKIYLRPRRHFAKFFPPIFAAALSLTSGVSAFTKSTFYMVNKFYKVSSYI
jgi:predicted RND superfamily exporter protein